jgi:hypothetical protein
MKQKAAARKRGSFFYKIVDLGPLSTPKAFGAGVQRQLLVGDRSRCGLV